MNLFRYVCGEEGFGRTLCRKLRRLFKDGIKPFHIRFVGEEAVDHRGQFKEYFTLLFDEVKHQLFMYRW